MQIEKGIAYTTMDDVKNLMDLYTQAVEYYNSNQQEDRQRYYEKQLQKLLEKPVVRRVQQLHMEKEAARLEAMGQPPRFIEKDDGEVKRRIYENPPEISPVKKHKEMSELLEENAERKHQMALTVQTHTEMKNL